MKKVMFLAVMAISFISCSVYKVPYSVYSYSIDYSEYYKKGFFLTESNSVNFDYTPVASLTARSTAGYEVLKTKNETVLGDDYKQIIVENYDYGQFKYASIKDALTEIYNKAIKLGANGIINLKINYIPYEYLIKTKNLSDESYIVSGMAIKK